MTSSPYRENALPLQKKVSDMESICNWILNTTHEEWKLRNMWSFGNYKVLEHLTKDFYVEKDGLIIEFGKTSTISSEVSHVIPYKYRKQIRQHINGIGKYLWSIKQRQARNRELKNIASRLNGIRKVIGE